MAALILGLLLALAWPSSAAAQADSLVLLPSAARTADAASDSLVMPGAARGFHLIVVTTAGTGYSLTPRLQVHHPGEAASVWRTVTALGSAITTNTTTCVMVYAAVTTGGGLCFDAVLAIGVPRSRFRIVIDPLDATSATYSVSLVWLR